MSEENELISPKQLKFNENCPGINCYFYDATQALDEEIIAEEYSDDPETILTIKQALAVVMMCINRSQSY